jgi:hypothetical protein
MGWNYRVCKHKIKYKDIISKKMVETDTFDIREVYYIDEKIFAYSKEPQAIQSDTLKGIKFLLPLYNKAMEKPVLDLDEINKKFKSQKVKKNKKKIYPYKGGK